MKQTLLPTLNVLMLMTIALAMIVLALKFKDEQIQKSNCAHITSVTPAAGGRYFYTLSDGTKWWSTAVYQVDDTLCQVD